jgi:hypothetical protein
LTVGQQNVFLNCVEFGLELALTQKEQEDIRASLMKEFLAHRVGLLQDLQKIEDLWAEILAAPPEQRGTFRQVVRDSLLDETIRFPHLEMSGIIREMVKRNAEVVVAGEPRLTRRSFDSFLELIDLGARLRDRRIQAWDAETLVAFETALLKRVPGLSPEGRKWLANADIFRALIYRNWQQVAADERETIKRFLVEAFAPAPKPGQPLPVDLDGIPIPPPELFPCPTELPWEMR